MKPGGTKNIGILFLDNRGLVEVGRDLRGHLVQPSAQVGHQELLV